MRMPQWESKLNFNTIAILVGFATIIAGWGYGLAEFRSGQEATQKDLDETKAVVTTLALRVSANEFTLRKLDNHELRIANTEKATEATANAIQSLDKGVNDLSSDIRVVREILQRIEASQKARFQP